MESKRLVDGRVDGVLEVRVLRTYPDVFVGLGELLDAVEEILAGVRGAEETMTLMGETEQLLQELSQAMDRMYNANGEITRATVDGGNVLAYALSGTLNLLHENLRDWSFHTPSDNNDEYGVVDYVDKVKNEWWDLEGAFRGHFPDRVGVLIEGMMKELWVLQTENMQARMATFCGVRHGRLGPAGVFKEAGDDVLRVIYERTQDCGVVGWTKRWGG